MQLVFGNGSVTHKSMCWQHVSLNLLGLSCMHVQKYDIKSPVCVWRLCCAAGHDISTCLGLLVVLLFAFGSNCFLLLFQLCAEPKYCACPGGDVQEEYRCNHLHRHLLL